MRPLMLSAWIVGMFLQVAPPAAGLTVDVTSDSSRVQTVVWVLNSDSRFDDVAIHLVAPVGGHAEGLPPACTPDLVCAVHAPVAQLQRLVMTFLLDPPLMCGERRTYDVTVFGEVVSPDPALAGARFDRVQLGRTTTLFCPARVFLPLVDRAAIR